MNIQLVSVAERTKEIGIRSAIGASPRQIAVQFVAEAAVLSASGSLIGVGAGWLASSLMARAMAWQGIVSPLTVVIAAVFGTGVEWPSATFRHGARQSSSRPSHWATDELETEMKPERRDASGADRDTLLDRMLVSERAITTL